jgi:hypothetical protein
MYNDDEITIESNNKSNKSTNAYQEYLDVVFIGEPKVGKTTAIKKILSIDEFKNSKTMKNIRIDESLISFSDSNPKTNDNIMSIRVNEFNVSHKLINTKPCLIFYCIEYQAKDSFSNYDDINIEKIRKDNPRASIVLVRTKPDLFKSSNNDNEAQKNEKDITEWVKKLLLNAKTEKCITISKQEDYDNSTILKHIGNVFKQYKEEQSKIIHQEIEKILPYITLLKQDSENIIITNYKNVITQSLNNINVENGELCELHKISHKLFEATQKQLLAALDEILTVQYPGTKNIQNRKTITASFSYPLGTLYNELDNPDKLKKAIEVFTKDCKRLTNNNFSKKFLKAFCCFLAAAALCSLVIGATAGIASLTGFVGWSVLIGSIAAIGAGTIAAGTVYSLFPKTKAEVRLNTEMKHVTDAAELFLQF